MSRWNHHSYHQVPGCNCQWWNETPKGIDRGRFCWHNNPPLGVHRINEQKSNRYDNPNRKIQISIPQTEPLTSVHPLCKEDCCGILSSSFQPMGLQGPWHLRPLGTDYHAANSHFAHRAATAKAWSIQKRPAKGHPPSLSKELEMQVERNTYWMPIIPS